MLKELLNSHIFGYGLKERGIVLVSSFFFAGVGFGLGYALDLQFGTKPLMAFAGVILSYPVAQVAIAKLLSNRVKHKETVESDKIEN